MDLPFGAKRANINGNLNSTRDAPAVGGAPPARRTMSDVAAQAAQNFFELERSNTLLSDENAGLRSHLYIAEEQLKNLEKDLREAQEARDYFKARFITVTTRLNVAAKVILDAMSDSEDPLVHFAPKQGTLKEVAKVAEQAIADAVSSRGEPDDKKEIPSFLTSERTER